VHALHLLASNALQLVIALGHRNLHWSGAALDGLPAGAEPAGPFREPQAPLQ
jgi:hypothetical protein